MNALTMQEKCAEWHAKRHPNHDRWLIITKLTEEVGELARAVLAEHDGRPDRGDIAQEGAQVMLVLYTLFGRFYPQIDLVDEVQKEYWRVTDWPPL